MKIRESRACASSSTNSTDNGAETFTWPDGGTTMFHGEKNTNWEGGHRVPTFIRWPGTIEPGTVVNDVGAHEDRLPTLVAAAGNPNATKQLLDGTTLRMNPFERAQHLRAPGTRPGARQAPSGAARAAGSCCAPSGGAGTWRSSGGGST